MPIVEHRSVVPVAPSVAFALSQSYDLRLDWDPFVREQRPLDGARVAAKGVRTYTRSRHGLSMVSEYLTFQPPHRVGMKMVKGPSIFHTFSGAWRFEPTPTGTEVVFRYNFTCRPTWMRWLMHPIGSWFLGRDIRRRLDAFAVACADPSLIARLPTD